MPIRVNTLVVMAKAPEPGKAKTRLVPPLSFEEAAEVARCLLLDQLEHLRSYGDADFRRPALCGETIHTAGPI